ncbi:Non-classical arabinogalactan protein 31 [Carex littledalei]|uniref:Non-classical arabinogalactan protein 31 n=1 Tax=Carex littledalei TaxID=544730 RepID=A0A833VMZ3_9POAL|nr:Non-classical arabinogalactan protein 31 [Carex littledalei]
MKALLFLCLLISSAVFAYAEYDTTAPENSPPVSQNSAAIPLDPNTMIKVVIEGVVLCQDCGTARGTWSLLNSKPIKGAKVSVTCRDSKNRPAGFYAAETDDNGYFYCPFDVARFNNYFGGDPTKACFIRLLSSPDQGCNALTNINWGIVGAPASFAGKLFTGPDYTTVVLEAGALAFRPGWCPISG